jgi:hypothetical protein
MESFGFVLGPVAGSCEHSNEHFDSIKDGEFLTRWATISFLSKTLFHEVS